MFEAAPQMDSSPVLADPRSNDQSITVTFVERSEIHSSNPLVGKIIEGKLKGGDDAGAVMFLTKAEVQERMDQGEGKVNGFFGAHERYFKQFLEM